MCSYACVCTCLHTCLYTCRIFTCLYACLYTYSSVCLHTRPYRCWSMPCRVFWILCSCNACRCEADDDDDDDDDDDAADNNRDDDNDDTDYGRPRRQSFSRLAVQAQPQRAFISTHTSMQLVYARLCKYLYARLYACLCTGQQHTVGFTRFVTKSLLVAGASNARRGAAGAGCNAESG